MIKKYLARYSDEYFFVLRQQLLLLLSEVVAVAGLSFSKNKHTKNAHLLSMFFLKQNFFKKRSISMASIYEIHRKSAKIYN